MATLRSAKVSVLGVDVLVKTDLDWLPDQSMFRMWDTHLEHSLETRVIVFRTAGPSSWQFDRNGALTVLLGTAATTKGANAFFSVVLFAAEICRQTHGIFQSHAAGVVFPTGSILLSGDSGAGKTIMTLRLGAESDAVYAGGDRVQLKMMADQLAVTGYWRNTRLRANSLEKIIDIPVVRRKLRPTVVDWLSSAGSGWDEKTTVHIDDLGLEPLSGTVPVSAIYDLRLLASVHKLEVEKLTPRDAVHALSAALSPVTAGFLTVLSDDGTPVMNPFHDAFPLAVEKKVALLATARSVPRFRLRGNMADVTGYILAQHVSGAT